MQRYEDAPLFGQFDAEIDDVLDGLILERVFSGRARDFATWRGMDAAGARRDAARYIVWAAQHHWRTDIPTVFAPIRQAGEHGDHVTPETLRTEVATLHGAINSLRPNIYRAMLLQAGAIVGAVVAILRLLG